MRKLNVIILCILFIIIHSCHSKYHNKKTSETKLSSSILEKAKLIKPEKNLPYKIRGTEVKILVYRDSVLIIENNDNIASKVIYEIFNLNRCQHTHSFLNYGPNYGEILSSTTCKHGDTLLVYDFVKSNVYIIDIPQLLDNPLYAFDGKPTNFLTQYMVPFRGALLCQNPNCFHEQSKKYNNNGSRFITTDTCFNYITKEKYEYDTFNVVRGWFDINHSKKRIIYLDAYNSVVEIYDLEQNLLNKTTGPECGYPIYSVLKYNNVTKGIVFSKYIPESYVDFAYDQEYIYAAYTGKSVKNDKDRTEFESYILKFDWDGIFVESYKLQTHIKSLSVSEDGKYLYVYGM